MITREETMPYNTKEKAQAQKKRYRAANKEKIAAAQRKWAEENKEHKRAYMKEYRAKNKERDLEKKRIQDAAGQSRRRARIKGNTPELTQEERGQILEYYMEAAHRTSSTTINWEVDHIVPVSLGGAHVPWNLQVVPRLWNEAKSNNSSERWPYAY